MKKPNTLVHETSPYLLQHAYNPVHWYPWGSEAFARAKREEKPVFLSVGYSTCHWCHVMERESFEDEEVARLLNESFIAIKVDREERPDVDAVYMGVCQAMTGSGGWPLTVLMTPDQQPFFTGTYFPKHSGHGRLGLMDLLEITRRKWRDERENLEESGRQVAAAFSGNGISEVGLTDGKPVVEAAYEELRRSYDSEYGGFGKAPKFPMPHQLMFLLRCHSLGIGGKGLQMVEHTLAAMYRGGIYDHIGGGFSRYSTDGRWLAPHFEKMLYDNALLVIALLECWQVTRKPVYKEIAERTVDYVRREMTSPEGGFYCAQDADSEGEEGKYYTFSKTEVIEILGAEKGGRFCKWFGITGKGNFAGRNIPNLLHHPAAELPDEELQKSAVQLLSYRSQRHRLHKDDKILTAWNALMIAALAKAGRVLGKQEYVNRAQKACRFVEHRLTKEDGSLLVSYRDGKATGTAFLDDYAFLAWACLELYEATFEMGYIKKACVFMEQALSRFSRKEGGFYLSPEDGEALLFRPVEQYDGAIPSGNSVAAWCLARLAALTGEERWRSAAQRQLEAYSPMFQSHPAACTFALQALLLACYPAQELLCVLPGDSHRSRLSWEWGGAFNPQTSILVKTPEQEKALSELAPYTKSYPIGGQAAFYLCRNYSCSAPVADLDKVFDMLK